MDLEQQERDGHSSIDNSTDHDDGHIGQSFSSFIDAVGYGPFQTRVVLLCGMVCMTNTRAEATFESAMMRRECPSYSSASSRPVREVR